MNATEIRAFFEENHCIQKLWGPQLIASFGVPLCFVILSRIMILMRRFKMVDKMCSEIKCDNAVFVRVQSFAVRTIAGKNLFGKVLAFLRLVTTLATGTILIYVTYREHQKDRLHYLQVYFCIPWTSDILLMVDGCMQIIFFFNFLLSAIGTENILEKLVSMSSIVEYATAISNIAMIVDGHHNYGLRFLNYLRLTSTAKIMIQLHVIRGNRNILIVKLVSSFCSFWLCGAGLFLLLNGVDDAFRPTIPNNQLRYFDTLYFLLITMSTVGYGDVLPVTIPTQTFAMIFIVYALGLFASFIPQVGALVDSGGSYTGYYTRRHGIRHIVVCGNNVANCTFVINMVKVIYHKSRHPANKNLHIVFLSQQDPDKDLEIYLTKKWTKLTYIKGSVFNVHDQHKSQLRYADTVILLMDDLTTGNVCSVDERDRENVMRVILVKRVNPDVQVIVQLTRWRSKAWLASIQQELQRPDVVVVVCLGQIRSGLLGGCGPASCPGLSTILLNWMSPYTHHDKAPYQETWKKYYQMGAKYSLYEVYLSPAFDFTPFKEAVKMCYMQLGVILLAVNTSNQIAVNPSNLKLQSNEMKVFVLASSIESAKRLETFCPSDYLNQPFSNSQELEIDVKKKKVPQCPCSTSMTLKKRVTPATIDRSMSHQFPALPNLSRTQFLHILFDEETSMNRSNQIIHDISGLFYWVRQRSFDEVLLSPLQAHQCRFRNHLVIHSPSISQSNRPSCLSWLQDLPSQILPLRSTQLKVEHLRDVVLLLDNEYIEFLTPDHIPKCLYNLPHFYMVPGSAQSSTIMEAININKSYACIILNLADDTSSLITSCQLNQSNQSATIHNTISNQSKSISHISPRYNIPSSPFIVTEINNETHAAAIINVDREYPCGKIIPVDKINNVIFHSIFEPTSLRLLEALFSWESSGVTESIMLEPFFPMLPSNPNIDVSDLPITNSFCRICLLPVNHPLIRMDKKVG